MNRVTISPHQIHYRTPLPLTYHIVHHPFNSLNPLLFFYHGGTSPNKSLGRHISTVTSHHTIPLPCTIPYCTIPLTYIPYTYQYNTKPLLYPLPLPFTINMHTITIHIDTYLMPNHAIPYPYHK